MTTRHVTLADLQRIARDSGQRVTVDSVRRVAYLRLVRCRYEAPLAEAAS